MFPFGGATTSSVPAPALNDSLTIRWSMSKAWVGVPGRMRTTEPIEAASGVVTSKLEPYSMAPAGASVIVGR